MITWQPRHASVLDRAGERLDEQLTSSVAAVSGDESALSSGADGSAPAARPSASIGRCAAHSGRSSWVEPNQASSGLAFDVLRPLSAMIRRLQ